MKAKVIFIYRVNGYYGQREVKISGADSKEFYKNLNEYKKKMGKTHTIVDYVIYQEII